MSLTSFKELRRIDILFKHCGKRKAPNVIRLIEWKLRFDFEPLFEEIHKHRYSIYKQRFYIRPQFRRRCV